MRGLRLLLLELIAVVLSFVGGYALLLWGLWAATSITLIALSLSGVHGARFGPWNADAPLIATAIGLAGALTKRGGDALARWVYEEPVSVG